METSPSQTLPGRYVRCPVARFWARVDKNGPIHPVCGQCWVWIGRTQEHNGYGYLCIKNKWVMAHRFSYELNAQETIPEGKRILHACDNRICVNPAHLSVGTDLDNVHDMMKKGRARIAKLTPEQVAEIKRLYKWHSREFGTAALAKRYGVTQSTIWLVVSGNSWNKV